MKDIDKRDLELLNYIKSTDKIGTPRMQAFNNFAKKYELCCETVRNLYYHLIKQYNLESEHTINRSKNFTLEEQKYYMSKVVDEINSSHSVRCACYKVSNGDAKLMLRLQNKFRSLMKKNIKYLENLGLNTNAYIYSNGNKFLKKENNYIIDDGQSNISTTNKNDIAKREAKVLKMPNVNNALTDSDINNLFMGLVKMVKRNAINNAPKYLKDECDLVNSSLKEALMKLGISTRKLEIVKSENFELKQKLMQSEKLLEQARSEVSELIKKIDTTGKIEELKSFLQNYKRKLGDSFFGNYK